MRVEVDLYGSLALTGKGHATDRAVLLGLAGQRPDSLDPDDADDIGRADPRERPAAISAASHEIAFDEARDLRFHQRERLPHHSNGMRFTAFGADGAMLESGVYYSVGGGAVVDEAAVARNAPPEGAWDVPFDYHSGDELLAIAEREGLTHRRDRARQRARAHCPTRRSTAGSTRSSTRCRPASTAAWRPSGILPGGLNVKRRAPALHRLLSERAERALVGPADR